MVEKTYKAIGVDLDETLLDTEKRISATNRACIGQAREHNCRIIVCSGRAPAAMRRYIDELGPWDKEDVYIALNGCMMFKAATHEAVEANFFPYEYAADFIEIARRNQSSLNLHLYRDDEYYVERRDETTDVYEARTGTEAKLVSDLHEVVDERLLKLVFITKSPQGLRMVQNNIGSALPAEVKGFISSSTKAPYLYEVVPSNINKGIALERAVHRLSLGMEDVICIGDSYNDIPMIQRAGLGVAVANAEDPIKESADYVTKRTNDQDAVTEVIKRFILVE